MTILLACVLAPAAASAQATLPSGKISQLAPSAPGLATVAARNAVPGPDLPYTGDDLLGEAAAALFLIGAGALIRLRW